MMCGKFHQNRSSRFGCRDDTHTHAHTHTDRQAEGQTYIQSVRHRQTGRQIDRHKQTQTQQYKPGYIEKYQELMVLYVVTICVESAFIG